MIRAHDTKRAIVRDKMDNGPRQCGHIGDIQTGVLRQPICCPGVAINGFNGFTETISNSV